MIGLVPFLIEAAGISLSGVVQPGALTAATISAGTRHRWAGTWAAIGHGLVELPLVILIIHGLDDIIKLPKVKIGIGLAGGVFLLIMAISLFFSIGRPGGGQARGSAKRRHPLWTGVILSAGNPYFLLWWATIGLGLATRAEKLGMMAFALFAAIHWSLDLIWLTALSWTTFKGGRLMGEKGQRIMLSICVVALVYFAGLFLIDAGRDLLAMLRPAY